MFVQMSNAEASNDSTKKMFEMHKELQETRDQMRQLMEENDQMKRRETEMNSYSFMNVNTNQRSFNQDPNFPLEQSAIDHRDQEPDDDENGLQNQVVELRNDLEEYKKKNEEAEGTVRTLETENDELKR